ncbi:MAG: hypothetical protein MUO54_02435, partial [Anaerolineales bacterium]|nr:hypothetical protein [Anaerolineales bacterium]
YITRRVKIGTKTVQEKIPVTRYITKKVQEWKKFSKKIPLYRIFGSRRIQVGTRTETSWRKVPVIKRVAYQTTKTITRQVPQYKEVKGISGYTTVTEKVPTYENKKILVGHKTVTETKPVYEEQRVQVGTKTVTRQVPDYQTVRVVVGYDYVPKDEVNASHNDDDGKEDPELTDHEKKLVEKLVENSEQVLPPPTGFSNEVWNSLSKEDQKKILADSSNSNNSTEEIDDAQKNWITNLLHSINENVITPYKFYRENPDEILKLVNPGSLPKILSVSARETWDFNLFTQEGILAGTYVPPNLLQLFYMEQKFNIEQKAVFTINPGSLINYDFTAATGSVKLGKNISYIFGPGEMGFSFKRFQDNPDFDYLQAKHSFQVTWRGLTYKHKEERVIIDKELSSDEYQVKLVGISKCETKTIKTEGVLALVLSLVLFGEIGMSMIGTGLLNGLAENFSGGK